MSVVYNKRQGNRKGHSLYVKQATNTKLKLAATADAAVNKKTKQKLLD